MTVLAARISDTPANSTLPLAAWNSGLSPNRRWVRGRLPASGSLPSWTSQYGDLILPVIDAAKPLAVGTEGAVRYALSSGAAAEGFNINSGDPTTLRTAVIIARPNIGDTIVGTGRLIRFGDTGGVSQADADTVFASGGAASLPAARGKWHVYAVSLPAVGGGGNGVFVVDGNSTTFTYSDAAWDASSLRIAAVPGSSSGRQLRILEILTSAGTFNAAQLIALYAKAKAWYPGLAW